MVMTYTNQPILEFLAELRAHFISKHANELVIEKIDTILEMLNDRTFREYYPEHYTRSPTQ